MNPFRIWSVLIQDEGASTLRRLFTSRHVADLQLIFFASFILMIIGSIFVAVWHVWFDTTGVIGSGALISAIVGTGCGVLAWCYLTGSSRLGVVDLFACEIATLCKVIAVTETAPNLIRMYDDPPAQSLKFYSEEEYSPIFNNNSKDLEVLEARVVEPVTEFYTYLKAMRDYLRRLGQIDQPKGDLKLWRNTLNNTLYMMFLMLESARKSTRNLIEFAPEQVETQIIILLSELPVYGYLLRFYEKFKSSEHDSRLVRLRLRKHEYPGIVADVFAIANANRGNSGRDKEAWERVTALLESLNQRFAEAYADSPNPGAKPPDQPAPRLEAADPRLAPMDA